MTFDPTTNRVPFGFLTPDEHESLRAWPHGWQYYDPDFEYWAHSKGDNWVNSFVYRGNPAPVVTSAWFNVYPTNVYGNYKSRETAYYNAFPRRIAVLRIDTCIGVSTAHLEGVENDLP